MLTPVYPRLFRVFNFLIDKDMTTFKATVKTPRNDGFYTVYIRVTHQRKTSYIKTNKIIDAAHISKNGDLTDPVVNEYCAMLIR
ncbi:MAG: hypothetical protein LUC45_05495, partial [Paraprevotella sp.]|nr:hypothetical protein [Paraprevotella sp.]